MDLHVTNIINLDDLTKFSYICFMNLKHILIESPIRINLISHLKNHVREKMDYPILNPILNQIWGPIDNQVWFSINSQILNGIK
jgi:hypothetical protein